MPGNEEWLSSADAAKSVGVTVRTLYVFINAGKLRAYKFGRVVRVRKSDLDIWVETCAVPPGTVGHLAGHKPTPLGVAGSVND